MKKVFWRRRVFVLPALASLCLALGGLPLYFSKYHDKLTLFDASKRVENFRRMEQIFPARLIERAGKAHQFPEAIRALDIRYNMSRVAHVKNGLDKDLTLEDFYKRTQATSLLVLDDGKLVYEKYLQGNSRQSRNTSWSVAKSFISALIGMAVADGKIDSIDDPVTKYVPMLEKSGYKEVPIKHILQMSSGIKFSEVYSDKGSDVNAMFYELFLFQKSVEEYTASRVSERRSGEVMHYASIDTQVLGILLQRVTGKTVSANLQEKLWQPLGMETDAYWNTDEYGVELSFCMLNATSRDYAKFGLLFCNNGRWQGKQIIPESWVEESVTPDCPHLRPGQTPYGWGYQYQWWIPQGDEQAFSACGIWGQYIYVNPKARVVIVKTSCDPDHKMHKNENATVFKAIVEALK